MARQQARRQHRERLAGIVLALLGVAVLVVAVIALHNPKGKLAAANSSSSAPTRTITRPASQSSKTATTAKPQTSASSGGSPTDSVRAVPLVVLNNSTVTNLARQAAQRFESGGWTVTHFANYQNNIISTCAYYDANDAQARSAAEALQQQYPTIKRVQPKFPELPSGPVVVVLTGDYSTG
jgi:cytoskeletal protein RodZ